MKKLTTFVRLSVPFERGKERKVNNILFFQWKCTVLDTGERPSIREREVSPTKREKCHLRRETTRRSEKKGGTKRESKIVIQDVGRVRFHWKQERGEDAPLPNLFFQEKGKNEFRLTSKPPQEETPLITCRVQSGHAMRHASQRLQIGHRGGTSLISRAAISGRRKGPVGGVTARVGGEEVFVESQQKLFAKKRWGTTSSA